MRASNEIRPHDGGQEIPANTPDDIPVQDWWLVMACVNACKCILFRYCSLVFRCPEDVRLKALLKQQIDPESLGLIALCTEKSRHGSNRTTVYHGVGERRG